MQIKAIKEMMPGRIFRPMTPTKRLLGLKISPSPLSVSVLCGKATVGHRVAAMPLFVDVLRHPNYLLEGVLYHTQVLHPM